MRNPNRVLIWMSLFLLAVAVACALLAEPLRSAFMANAVFNSLILAVLAVGILINYRQVLVLGPEVSWIEAFRRAGEDEAPDPPQTGLLGSMARMLTGRHGDRFSLSTMSMRALLDAIRSRLDEQRDLSRYMIGLLVFLGLLGTFWGLLDTLRAVGGVISGLSFEGREAAAVFGELKAGLQQPLAGMGTAFSSSLFGLAGALVLGFVDLQAGYAQNRFYNDLEEWLSGQTKLGSGAAIGEGEGSVPAYIQALLEQTADSLDKLQRIIARGEEERRAADQRLTELTEEIANLAEQSRSEQRGLMNLTKVQSELQGVLQNLADVTGGNESHEREVRDSLRHIAGSLDHLRQGLSGEREHVVNDLREELRLLTRTLSHLRSSQQG
ncbi:flagellar motor protein MotA [Arhodomonas sp. AD133]|uniref:flagellar motor protein MotA n=1 Tax=Arhodomonas sp. AD133 TaxID=3415009 RepID=UPI003EBDAD49